MFSLHRFAKVWKAAVPLGNVMVGLLVSLHVLVVKLMVWWSGLVHGVVEPMVRRGDNIVCGRYRSVKTLADRVIAGLSRKPSD